MIVFLVLVEWWWLVHRRWNRETTTCSECFLWIHQISQRFFFGRSKETTNWYWCRRYQMDSIFWCVLYSSVYPVVVFTYQNPLTFLHKMKNKSQRLMRWGLELQDHNIVIKHIKGKKLKLWLLMRFQEFL